MRSFFKILSILMIGGTTAFNVVACNKCTTDNNGGSVPPDNKLLTYDVSFKEIISVDGSGFDFRNSGSGGRRLFVIYEKDISGASDLPSEFWVKNSSGDKFAYFYVVKDNIWDKVASVYGFNRNSTHDDIVSLMNKNIIVNVFMSVNFKGMNGAWNLLDFQVK